MESHSAMSNSLYIFYIGKFKMYVLQIKQIHTHKKAELCFLSNTNVCLFSIRLIAFDLFL